MAIIVEDGTGVAGANSYVTEAELTTYATSLGYTLTLDAELLLIKAMEWIEIQSYKGDRVECDQGLEFPRTAFILRGSCWQDASTIPDQLKNQQMYVAVGIDQGFDPTAYEDRAAKSESNPCGSIEYLAGDLSHYRPSVKANRFYEILAKQYGAFRA